MNNYNRIVLLLFLILGTNIPVLGMKRANKDMQEVKPPVAGDILQLPHELLCRIIMSCRAPWRNALRNVCKQLRELASKQNPALHDNLDNVSLEDKKEFLTKYLAVGNIPMVSHIMQSCPPQTLRWLKKRWLLDYLDVGNIAMAKAILEHCPENEFSKNNITYNYVLCLKCIQRRHQDKTGAVNILVPLIGNHNIRAICTQLKHEGDLDRDGPVQKLIANQQQDVVAWVEQQWKQQFAKITTDVWPYIKLLRHAAILNNHAMVKALLQTTPFKTYFSPIAPAEYLYTEQYPNLLYDACQYGDAALFADIFSWSYPIKTLEQLQPHEFGDHISLILDRIIDAIHMDKSQYLKPMMHYIEKARFIDFYYSHKPIACSLATKSWSCLTVALDSASRISIPLGINDRDLPLYNSVLHEAELFKGPAPIERMDCNTFCLLILNRPQLEITQGNRSFFKEQQEILRNIRILKKYVPTMFAKLASYSSYVYTQRAVKLITEILQPGVLFDENTHLPLLDHCPPMMQNLLPMTVDIRTALNSEHTHHIIHPFLYDPAIIDFVIDVAYEWHSYLTSSQQNTLAQDSDATDKTKMFKKNMTRIRLKAQTGNDQMDAMSPMLLDAMGPRLQSRNTYINYDSIEQFAERLAMVIKELKIYRDSTIQKNSH